MALRPSARMDSSTIRDLFEPISGRARMRAPIKDGDSAGAGTAVARLFSSLAPMEFGSIALSHGLGGRVDTRS